MPLSSDEEAAMRRLALGRIFSILSRAGREGDVEEYQSARRAFFSTYDEIPGGYQLPHAASVLTRHKAKFGD